MVGWCDDGDVTVALRVDEKILFGFSHLMASVNRMLFELSMLSRGEKKLISRTIDISLGVNVQRLQSLKRCVQPCTFIIFMAA